MQYQLKTRKRYIFLISPRVSKTSFQIDVSTSHYSVNSGMYLLPNSCPISTLHPFGLFLLRNHLIAKVHTPVNGCSLSYIQNCKKWRKPPTMAQLNSQRTSPASWKERDVGGFVPPVTHLPYVRHIGYICQILGQFSP